MPPHHTMPSIGVLLESAGPPLQSAVPVDWETYATSRCTKQPISEIEGDLSARLGEQHH